MRHTAERYREARMRSDKELIAYGAYVAKVHGSSWVRCESCDSFGDMRLAGVTRTAGSVYVVCRGCAVEHGYRLLPLVEAVAIASADVRDERSPVVALDIAPYERAEIAHDARPRAFAAMPIRTAHERRMR